MNAAPPEHSQGSMPSVSTANLMSAADYRESLRRYRPVVYVDGQLIDSVADAPSLQPGVNALGVTYDFAHDAAMAPLMTAVQTTTSGQLVNRMLHINESAGDLLNKLEAVRLLCQETGLAQEWVREPRLPISGAERESVLKIIRTALAQRP